MTAPPLSLQQVNGALRWRLHLLTGLAVVFLGVYGKVVCPFMDRLSFGRILVPLLGVFLLQAALREALYRWAPRSPLGVGAARHGFHVAVIAWLAAGAAATLVHELLYQDFPLSSHFKLLAGYWGLGAGILSQLEYVILERAFRNMAKSGADDAGSGGTGRRERIARRLVEGFFLFTLIPSMIMALMSFRFVYEGFTDPGAAIEVLFLGGCFVTAALFISWRFGQALGEDCREMEQAVAEVSAGRFQVVVDASRPDELGRVAGGINRMAEGLAQRERIREAFGRFVNPQVAEQVIAGFAQGNGRAPMGGERRQAAILMADLRDFTPLSERLDPVALTGLLNAYFSEMVAAIQAHGGMVDKFIGDAVMAVFGLAPGDENPTANAVDAAREMRDRLARFNADASRNQGHRLENGVGIHFGEVVAGLIGSPDRLEFTVIGHPVNLAARICGEAKPPRPPLLISRAAADLLPERFALEVVCSTQLKGVTGATELLTTR